MKFKLALAGTGILLIIFSSIGWYMYNKPHAGISNIEADVHITAASLYNDFLLDEATANKKYLNKIIEVTGNISDIQKLYGSQIILLGSDEALGGVSCKLSNDENDKNSTAKILTTVTIKGKCSGYLMDVNLVDCVLK
ncbi:MAG: hypothetical protein ABIO55_10975 [Ginsengibacter sp.]